MRPRAGDMAAKAALPSIGAAALMLFASCEGEPGFVALPCCDGDLEAVVARALDIDPQDMPGTEVAGEVSALARFLRRDGNVAFDGGWMVLAGSLQAAAAFLMGKLRDAELSRREAAVRAKAWEARYRHLALALSHALGERRGEIAALAEG